MIIKDECSASVKGRAPRLVIGADFVPTNGNSNVFAAGDGEALVGPELLALVQGVDFGVFNLEVPLTDTLNPIAKCGPCLDAPTSTIAGLKAVNPWAFTLANNHIMDQGVDGLRSTMDVLEGAGLQYFGAGANLTEAKKPLVVDIDGVTVGIFGCVEHEFSIAGEFSAGAAPYDPLDSFDDVRDLASRCDYVIVLYHGGKEHYRYPSPQLQRRCRKFAECGAQLVVCQHSHCIGCKENWADATIVYGQGNFLFDDAESDDNECWKTGLLLEVELGDQLAVEYHPLVKMDATVRLATGSNAEAILNDFISRSEEIEEVGFVEKSYGEFARGMLNSYLACGIPGSGSLAFRVLNKLSRARLADRLVGANAGFALLNHVECEAHNELLIEGLRLKCGLGSKR